MSAPVAPVFRALRRRYGAPVTGAEDPFQVLIATILSQRTNDDVTFPAAQRLFARFPDARALARADARTVERLVKPVGFYRTKALAIVEVARVIMSEHGGCVPEAEADLLALPHVGRKTMNCVLVYGFGRSVVAVDTHVHRIANRLGWATTEHPDETEPVLAARLNARQRGEVNELLVRFGREICRPVGPRCGDCPVARACPSRRDVPARGLGEPEGRTMLSRIAEKPEEGTDATRSRRSRPDSYGALSEQSQ